MVMAGAEKQAGRLWDKFGMKEVVKEKCDTLYVGHHHKAMACVCHTQEGIFWKLEGDISVSDEEIPSEFERWGTTCTGRPSPYCRRTREYGMRLKRSNYVFVTFGVFEVCNA